MEKTPIMSSHILDVGYDETLFIRFKNGAVYRYDAVSYAVFDALRKAESVGKFFHAFVNKKFSYVKLESDPFAAQ